MGQLEEMRVFVEIAKAEGITGAAHRLDMAPSAVSRRLKDLESRLGVQLLTRTTRQVNLTECGRTFLAQASRILEEVQEAENEIVSSHDRLSGTMRVSAPVSWGLQTLPPLVSEFMALHDELKIEIDLSERRIDLVEESFDIALRIGQLPDSSLIARRLASVKAKILVSPKFLKQHGPITQPDKLEQFPGLLYAGSSRADVWHWKKGGKEGRVTMRMRMKSNNGEILTEAAAAGHGVTLMPDFLCDKAIEEGRLVSILEDCDWGDMLVYAVYPPTRHLASRTRTFIDFLAEKL